MLTGESTPITKTNLLQKNQLFDAKNDYKFLLYAGTKVVQKRSLGNSKAMGIVYGTGFNTKKGNLIRSILYPKEVEFKFKKDSARYMFFMAGLSFVGYFISVPFMLKNGVDFYTILERSLDLLTTTVPPSLPTCLAIGISYALFRLRKWGIICINRDRVNVTGRVNMVCFDKTGTLTEDHLDVTGFRPTKLSQSLFSFDSFVSSVKEIQKEAYDYYKEMAAKDEVGSSLNKPKGLKKLFAECLASCHGITRVNGKIVGDPIDVKMFEASGWQLNENADNQENYDSLVKYYLFSIFIFKFKCLNILKIIIFLFFSHY